MTSHREVAVAGRFERPLEMMLDAVPLALFTVNLDGIITYAAGGGLAVFGGTAADFVGHSYQELSGGAPWVIQGADRAFQGEVMRVVAPMGDFWLDVQVVPERKDGQVIGLIGLCFDVTERTRALSLLRATIDATADGILVIDLHGKVTLYNQQFVEMWRIRAPLIEPMEEERLLRFVVEQVHDPEAFTARVRELYTQPELESFDVVQCNDGRYIERLSKPQRIESRIVGRVWSFRDVTQRKLSEAALQQAVRVRDEFLSIASHELNTPIHSLTLALQALAPDDHPPVSPEKHARMLELAMRQVQRLNELVGSLLDVTRVDTSRLELVRERVELGQLVEEVAARFAADLARAGSAFTLHAEPGVVGIWDRSRLEQVVTNLISNAIKFGSGRPIEVSVRRDTAPSGACAVVAIVDHGIGIAPEQLEAVFGRFVRAVSSRHFGGLGLGLHVCRKLVEAHGGTLHATAQLGQGSTFTVSLPLDERQASS